MREVPAVIGEVRKTRVARPPFARRQSGVTSIEYALIAALIAMAIIVSVTSVGAAVGDLYSHVAHLVGCTISGC